MKEFGEMLQKDIDASWMSYELNNDQAVKVQYMVTFFSTLYEFISNNKVFVM